MRFGLIRGLIRVFKLPPLNPNRPLPPGPCVLAGFFGTVSGLGESARQMLRVMRRACIDVHTANVSQFAFIDMPGGNLWPENLPPGGAVLLLFNPDVMYPVLNSLLPHGVTDHRMIAYWHWELPKLPASWVQAMRQVDEIWVPTRFLAEAVRRADRTKRVHVVPDCLDVDAMPLAPREDPFPQFAGRPLVFFSYSIFSSQARKNPEAVISAFCKAVDGMKLCSGQERPVLVVKTQGEAAWPSGVAALRKMIGDRDDILLIVGKFPRDVIEDMIARADIVMSLHRSEGFGYLMAEAMAAAKPVIATNWSGNVDFMTETCAVLVPYRLIPVRDPQGIYAVRGAEWADPDIEFAAAALRRLLENPDERQAMGQAAREHIRGYFSLGNWRAHLPEDFLAAIAPALTGSETA
jgi:glycosyltransferase involved in cell wall biosynthesis